MARPRKSRRCRAFAGDRIFKPRGIPMQQLKIVGLELSELEAMRLCDLEGLDQLESGRLMGISRGTVQRLLKSGRGKVLQTLVETHALRIDEGGHHEHQYEEES